VRDSEDVLPTVHRVLELPEVKSGRPNVLAGRRGMLERVRWVHVSELADIAPLLQGGELILTTGIAMPHADADLRQYVQELSSAGVRGLVVELGRRYSDIPLVLVRECERVGLPLVELRREIRFVKVTRAVHSLIVQERFAETVASERVHRMFTSLCLEGAGAAEIVRRAAHVSGCPVVFENLTRDVVAVDPAGSAIDDVLRDWQSRSRLAPDTAGSDRAESEGWLVCPVQARGESWGRLVLIPADDPQPLDRIVVEQAATALALNRLLKGRKPALETDAHGALLRDIIEGRIDSAEELHARSAALGVVTARRTLIAVVLDTRPDCAERDSEYPEETTDMVAAAAVRASGCAALVTQLGPGRVGMLVALPSASDRAATLRRLASLVIERATALGNERPIVGAGSTVTELEDVGRSFGEAAHAAQAARGSSHRKAYYELPDIQLQGLMYVLSGDPRLQAYVERTLGGLLAHDARRGTDLVRSLQLLFANGGNKTAAAAEAHMSRPAFYQRLSTIERLLGVDLDASDTRTSLHAAIMAWNAVGETSSWAT
jgi:PucR family transcriptional regulator, purine catabolism regulatory protein